MSVNERLIDSLQALLHVQEEYKVSAIHPTNRGRIMVRDGRIKFAEFGKKRGLDAVKAMITNEKLKISCLQMNWEDDERDYIDECDETIDEFLISYAFDLVNSNQPEAEDSGLQTRALSTQKLQQTGGLHRYDIYLEAKGGPLDGTVFYLNQGNNSIGTSEDNSVQIQHDTISRIHCTVILTENFIKIRDENSTNGTLVNGTNITEAFLDSGDELALGEVVLKLNLSLQAGHSSDGNTHSKWARKTGKVPELSRETINWNDFIKEEESGSSSSGNNFTQIIKDVFSEKNNSKPVTSRSS